MKRSCIVLAIGWFISVGCAGCVPTPTTTTHQICADTWASATVWEDLNHNGLREENEPPLSGICIDLEVPWLPYTKEATGCSFRTNETGTWSSSDYVAGYCGAAERVESGLAAQCRQVSISVLPPPGYVVTTATTVKDCRAEFGLVQLSTPQTGPTDIPTVTPSSPQ